MTQPQRKFEEICIAVDLFFFLVDYPHFLLSISKNTFFFVVLLVMLSWCNFFFFSIVYYFFFPRDFISSVKREGK